MGLIYISTLKEMRRLIKVCFPIAFQIYYEEFKKMFPI